jgi:hypothetical protein
MITVRTIVNIMVMTWWRLGPTIATIATIASA